MLNNDLQALANKYQSLVPKASGLNLLPLPRRSRKKKNNATFGAFLSNKYLVL